ncbi:MAG: PilT protein domain protein [Candidatus Beckwithbacteria bacterium GW2011_GWA2_43_10]|uniref:PilT protein domain protein n=1 Tax=Candidatus Beckwithbacteria bacterium GW2011_GWA2_43_10 TaxID=1618369 RepID=A0A0G1C539_9BACT|nr:MAG: PilT protein domain protein [Candidatus Beckwithbacteria bacterium GW2011_GWA2_43_10]
MPAENTKSIVVDASFILAFLLPDETFPAEALFDELEKEEIQFFSIPLLPFEVLNSIKIAIRRKRLKVNLANRLVKKFFELKIELLPINYHESFLLAVKNDLTVYDAGYLWLAKNKKVKLQTLDKQLGKIVS